MSSQSQPGGAADAATPTARPSARGVARDIAGETVCGFRVAAWRETHPEHGDKYGHRYSEHWSTPSGHPAVVVERLFTEGQLRAALALAQVEHEDLCRISRVFNRHADLRDDADRRANEALKRLIEARSQAGTAERSALPRDEPAKATGEA